MTATTNAPAGTHDPAELAKFAIIVYFATAFPPALEAMADPSGTDFAPRPEWYFLGLYELLKIMPAGWEIVATAIVPGIVTIGMFLVPWLDRSKSRHPGHRTWIILAGIAVILMIGVMTLKGIIETPPPVEHPDTPITERASSR